MADRCQENTLAFAQTLADGKTQPYLAHWPAHNADATPVGENTASDNLKESEDPLLVNSRKVPGIGVGPGWLGGGDGRKRGSGDEVISMKDVAGGV